LKFSHERESPPAESGKTKESVSMSTVKPKTQNKPTHPPPDNKQQLTVSAPATPALTSDEALDRHLAEWGGSGGRLFAFNGSTGIHRTLDDDVEVVSGSKFVTFLNEAQKGFIKFNPGGPPDLRMVRISENADVPARETLGDLDERAWPLGLSGEKQDPWKEQYAVPMARHDAGAELYIYIARGQVAMNSVSNLLGRWRHHPNRQVGLIPVVEVKNGTYHNKRFNADRPKPELTIVGWVTKTGAAPAAIPAIDKPSLAQELNDEIGF
jgi:hypothetical protein